MSGMKKFIVLIMILILTLFTLTGCNMSCSPGNYNYNRVHISVGGKELCKEILNWHDNDIGCEVALKDGNSLYLSEGTYILIKDKCPICGE